MRDYKQFILNMFENDCPEHCGFAQGVSKEKCEQGTSCWECWYRALNERKEEPSDY